MCLQRSYEAVSLQTPRLMRAVLPRDVAGVEISVDENLPFLDSAYSSRAGVFRIIVYFQATFRQRWLLVPSRTRNPLTTSAATTMKSRMHLIALPSEAISSLFATQAQTSGWRS